MTPIADDLEALSRDELVAEVQPLPDGIRRHRDSTGQELCWHHPQLWGLLPDTSDPLPEVPDWPQFLRAASAIEHHSTSRFRTLPASTPSTTPAERHVTRRSRRPRGLRASRAQVLHAHLQVLPQRATGEAVEAGDHDEASDVALCGRSVSSVITPWTMEASRCASTVRA